MNEPDDLPDPERLVAQNVLDRLEAAGAELEPGMSGEDWEEELRRVEPSMETLARIQELGGEPLEAELERRAE